MSRLSLPLRLRLGAAAVMMCGIASLVPAVAQDGNGSGSGDEVLDRQAGEELVRSVEGLTAQRVPGFRRVVQIVAQGTVRNPGFTKAKLAPFPARNPPPDGMYEFVFTVVLEPGEPRPEQLTPVRVAYDWFGVPDNAAGIRVRAGANVIETRIAAVTDFDPRTLVGRRVARDGEPVGADDVILSNLPQPLRVARPGEPRPEDQRSERLNLVVDDGGMITDAFFG